MEKRGDDDENRLSTKPTTTAKIDTKICCTHTQIHCSLALKIVSFSFVYFSFLFFCFLLFRVVSFCFLLFLVVSFCFLLFPLLFFPFVCQNLKISDFGKNSSEVSEGAIQLIHMKFKYDGDEINNFLTIHSR